MRFHFLPKGNYKIGQIVKVAGLTLQVESYSHTGKNLVACTRQGAPRFQRVMVILTDSPTIECKEDDTQSAISSGCHNKDW